MKYFGTLKTVEEIKAHFGRLAREHHPQIGGDTATFSAIYQEYQSALKSLDRSTSTGSDNKSHTYFYSEVEEREIADMLGRMLGLKMPGVTVALIGKWLWTRGDTKPYREQLKALGCRYSGDKESWYFHTGKYKKRSGRSASFSGMAQKYGYREFSQSEAQ